MKLMTLYLHVLVGQHNKDENQDNSRSNKTDEQRCEEFMRNSVLCEE